MHTFPAEPYGRSLISMLEELAVACGYGDPERHTTILKRCDMKLDAVRLAARTCKACVWSCKRIEPQTQGGGRQRPGECRALPQRPCSRDGKQHQGCGGPQSVSGRSASLCSASVLIDGQNLARDWVRLSRSE